MNSGSLTSRVSAADYRSIQAHNISALKYLRVSPKHYRYALEHPKETKPMTLGTAAHCAVLEPERFERQFIVWDRRSDAGNLCPRKGQYWDAFVAEAGDRTVLLKDEVDAAKEMQAAVRGNPDAMRYLESGEPEVSMQWELHIDGIDNMHHFNCKGRADWLTTVDGKPNLVGLKTARDHRHFVFGSAAAKLGYHLQFAYYHDGYKLITGKRPRMVEIVVESNPPHDVAVYVIPDDIIDQGRDEYQTLLRLLAQCERANEWPGVYTSEQALTLPAWVYGEQLDDISELGLEA
jgi:hypothetical protein